MTALPQTECLSLTARPSRVDIMFNRPERRNAINAVMSRELSETLDWLEQNPSTSLVTLSGADGNFCAGGDIKERRETTIAHEGEEDLIEARNMRAGETFLRFSKLRATTVALVEGAAFGGGMGYACLADITILVRGARLGMPETRLGIAPAQIAPWMVRRIGLSRAMQLALTGQRIDAQQAYELGVGQYICDTEDAQKTLQQVCSEVLACGPGARAASKEIMMRMASSGSPEEMIRFAARKFAELNRTGEGREGQAAFVEKRAPDWSKT